MANPLYGQNKADDMLDALANADDNIEDVVAGSGKIGNENCAPVKQLPITIAGVVYYLALYEEADGS